MIRPLAALMIVLALAVPSDAFTVYQWGTLGDIPVPGDYDGDGRLDLAVFRPSTGHWYVLRSSDAFLSYADVAWGMPGDVPTAGDYNGNGQTMVAVFRPSTGEWFLYGWISPPARIRCWPDVPGCVTN